MKRLLLSTLLITNVITGGYCIQSMTENNCSSSFTLTADSFKQIPGSRPGSEICQVVVGSTSSAVLTLFDNATAGSAPGALVGSTIAVVYAGVTQNPFFLMRVSSGITYNVTPAPTNGITIFYRNPNLP